MGVGGTTVGTASSFTSLTIVDSGTTSACDLFAVKSVAVALLVISQHGVLDLIIPSTVYNTLTQALYQNQYFVQVCLRCSRSLQVCLPWSIARRPESASVFCLLTFCGGARNSAPHSSARVIVLDRRSRSRHSTLTFLA